MDRLYEDARVVDEGTGRSRPMTAEDMVRVLEAERERSARAQAAFDRQEAEAERRALGLVDPMPGRGERADGLQPDERMRRKVTKDGFGKTVITWFRAFLPKPSEQTEEIIDLTAGGPPR